MLNHISFLLLLVLLAGPVSAQVLAISPGSALIRISVPGSQGPDLRDSALVVVLPRVPVKLLIFIDVTNGVGVQLNGTSWLQGEKTSCLFYVAPDRNGVPITGLRPQVASSNPGVALIAASPGCPDTTVDLLKLPNPVPHP